MPASLFTIGDVVRKLRALKGWTQIELAERAALNKETVKNLEADPDKAERRTIVRVCKALGVSEADLYAYAEPLAMSALDREHWALWKRMEPDKAQVLLGLATRYDEQRQAREMQQRSEAAATRAAADDPPVTKVRRGSR